MDGIKKVQGRWYPSRFIFKDELKRNSKGTEWIVEDIQFDIPISKSRFSTVPTLIPDITTLLPLIIPSTLLNLAFKYKSYYLLF